MKPSITLAAFAALTIPLGAQEWRVINLHPPGADSSAIFAVEGSRQGGLVDDGLSRAAIWSGTPESVVSLHPAGSDFSSVFGMSGDQQGGEAGFGGESQAGLWTGSVASFVNLHPGLPYASSDVRSVRIGRQAGTAILGGESHAVFWDGSEASFTDLNAGFTGSLGQATDGFRIGGSATSGGVSRAGFWNGAPGTFVSLHPAGASESVVTAMVPGQEGGMAKFGPSANAGIWSGTPESFVNLHPPGAVESILHDTDGVHQVGQLEPDTNSQRAVLWMGSAASMVDLQSFLPPQYTLSDARSVTMDGDSVVVGGYAFDNVAKRTEAILWRKDPRNPTIQIRGGKRVRTKRTRFVVRGSATDPDNNLARIQVKAGKRGFRNARGLQNWRFVVRIRSKRTPIRARAIDSTGLSSTVARQVILRR